MCSNNIVTGILFTATAIIFRDCFAATYNNCVPKECEVRLRIDAGWLCGRMRSAEDATSYASFRGVPYAKPPLRERRFKELEPTESWDYLYDATEDSPACPQKNQVYSRIPLQVKGMSEDCIYLNLHLPMSAIPNYTEQRTEGKKPGVPILVMVHGGAFIGGSGLTDMHGPEFLMTKQVIVITFNFRTNIFGFLSLNTAKIPGNQALRDIITLLKWVQRNAQAFGGNPDDVTLMGHSSGGACAHFVSLSEAAKGLFHKLILMSGTAISNAFIATRSHAKSVSDQFIAALGIDSLDPDYIHERLINEPLLNIMHAYSILQSKADIILLSLVPVVESQFPNVTRIIDDDPLALIAKGRGKQYPLVVGFTTDEFNYFRWSLESTDIVKRAEDDPTILLGARLRYNFSPSEQRKMALEVKKRCFKETPSLDNVIENYSELFFIHPSLVLAEWRSLAGAPVYLYQFSYESQRNIIKEAHWSLYKGVAHVEDLTYVFRFNSMMRDYVSYPPKNKDDLMRQWMPTLLVNFVRCGNPTCTKDESRWPPLSPGRLQYQNIAEPKAYQMKNLTDNQKEMMQFYDRFDLELRNVGEQLRKPHN